METTDLDSIDYSAITPDDMPTESMQAVAEHCGVKAAVVMINSFGGRALMVPVKQKTPLFSELRKTVGEDTARTIYEVFAGDTITIPTRRAILPMILPQIPTNNDSIARLTRDFRVNRSTIYRIKKESMRKMRKKNV